MKKYRLWFVALSIIALYMAVPVFAQDEGSNLLAGRPTLWIAVIIGIVASLATGVYAYQLKGGVVGSSLTFIAIGMLLVALGFVAVVINWAASDIQFLTHDVLFIIGYILMIVGALRLREMIR